MLAREIMPASLYRVWNWGSAIPISTEGACRVAVAAVAKPATVATPYRVANEVICTDIGRALRLPIPPGCVVVKEPSKIIHYVSLDFSHAGEELPPADARGVAREF